jgi:hypothetical protein
LLMFVDSNDPALIKTIFFFAYLAFLLYAYNKGRQFRLKKKEKKFVKSLQEALETEDLPLYKGEETVNWHKVYTMLKKLPDSPEKKKLIKEVQERKTNRGKN